MGRYARPDSAIAKGWMRDDIASDGIGEFVDGKTGEVNMTRLAEECAIALGHTEWLDDELHPIWEWSMQVAEGYERGHEPNATGLTAADLRRMLWAIPAGSNDRLDERPLTSMPLTPDQIVKVKAAAAKDGWHSFRTVAEDFDVPDFGAAVLAPARKRSGGRHTPNPGDPVYERDVLDLIRAYGIQGAIDLAERLASETGPETQWWAEAAARLRAKAAGHEPNATGLTAADLRKMRVSDEVNVPCGPAGENLFIKRTKRDEFFIRIPGHEHARWGTAQQAADDIEQFVQYGALPRSSGARMF